MTIEPFPWQQKDGASKGAPVASAHIAGTMYIGIVPITLAQAEALGQDVAGDFKVASDVWRRALAADLQLDAIRSRAEMDRLSGLATSILVETLACRRYRVAAGWRDPHDADARRVDICEGDD